MVLLGVEHLEQRRARIAAEIHSHLVDFVEQDDGIPGARVAQGLDDSAGKGADVGASVAADLGLVAHAAERDAGKLAVQGARDRASKRGLADAGGANQAQDGTLDRLFQFAYREIFNDPFLDLFQAEVVFVEYVLALFDIDAILRLLGPGQRHEPVDVVAGDGRLGRAGRHLHQLVQLFFGLRARVFRHLGFRDRFLQLFELVSALFAFAQLFLDRLHLLAQVVFLLDLLHLLANLAADLLFDHHDLELAVEDRGDLFEAGTGLERLEDLLLLLDLELQMSRDDVGKPARLLDVVGDHDYFERDLLVQLHVLLEQADHVPHERLQLDRLLVGDDHLGRFDLETIVVFREFVDFHPGRAFDEDLQNPVGQLEKLKNLGDGPRRVQVLDARIIGLRDFLRAENDLAVLHHRFLDRADRFLAADEQRNHHVRKHDHVAQGQQRIRALDSVAPGTAGGRSCGSVGMVFRSDHAIIPPGMMTGTSHAHARASFEAKVRFRVVTTAKRP
ncbi:MAG: hypothetical protein BWY66_01613 [bacterium ADurb.Bin374]|nr:MAG: hypothetical protein BWY66_01613 [bacterium ADurb.Bin374]